MIFSVIDLQSIDSMKQYMLMQLPGTKFLYLPAYDTARNLKEPTMDHLVRKKKRHYSPFTNLFFFTDMLCSWYACHRI